MASGYHGVIAGEKPPAATINDFWSKQVAMVYASAAARSADAALTAVLREGMLSFLLDVNALCVYTGTTWSTIGPVHGPWTAFSPTWTNLTVGNGTVTTSTQRIGRTIIYKVKLAFGSTTVVTGPITFDLPVAANAILTDLEAGGLVMYFDASAVLRARGWTAAVTASTVKLHDASGNNPTSATVPFTWAVNDSIYVTLVYEAAADA